MTNWKLFLCFLFAAVPAAANAQMAVEDQELLEPDILERPWITYRTSSCPQPDSGPGSSTNNPLNLEYFLEPMSSVILWRDPKRAAEVLKWEQENNVDLTYDLNCKWIKITGHFRQYEYQSYRGVLLENSQAVYTYSGGPGNFFRESLYFIESWADEKTRSAFINGADIEIIGQFYDLCRAAEKDEAESGQKWFILGGPCHYIKHAGMIKNAEILTVESQPYQRLKGEENRDVIGDIRKIPDEWPEWDTIKQVAMARIDLIRNGPKAYWTVILPNYDDSGKEIEKRASDPDNRISFLATDPKSPLLAKRRIEKNQFQLFRLTRYGGGETEEKIKIVYACFCTTKKCDDEWPLFSTDAEDFHDKYFCSRFDRQHDDGTKWD